jgi:hypothetical protein
VASKVHVSSYLVSLNALHEVMAKEFCKLEAIACFAAISHK